MNVDPIEKKKTKGRVVKKSREHLDDFREVVLHHPYFDACYRDEEVAQRWRGVVKRAYEQQGRTLELTQLRYGELGLGFLLAPTSCPCRKFPLTLDTLCTSDLLSLRRHRAANLLTF